MKNSNQNKNNLVPILGDQYYCKKGVFEVTLVKDIEKEFSGFLVKCQSPYNPTPQNPEPQTEAIIMMLGDIQLNTFICMIEEIMRNGNRNSNTNFITTGRNKSKKITLTRIQIPEKSLTYLEMKFSHYNKEMTLNFTEYTALGIARFLNKLADKNLELQYDDGLKFLNKISTNQSKMSIRNDEKSVVNESQSDLEMNVNDIFN